MNKKIFVPMLVATLSFSCALDAKSTGLDRETYVNSIITVLNIHKDAIKNLTSRDMKYSDNLVRHAIAVRDTFGLLGPMSWHAAESSRLHKKKAGKGEITHDKFDKLARNSDRALKDLVVATHEMLEVYDRDRLETALETMTNSCDACHVHLPRSVAPDVWGTLNKE